MWDVACEALQNRRHAQLALPGQNFFGEVLVPVDPALRQRPAPAVQAAHPLKRQIGRSGQKRADLLVTHAQAPADRPPHRLLAGHRQRHVHAVQGHPVDQGFPLVPVVPGQRIAKAAVVQKITVSRPANPPHLGLDLRQRVGHIGPAAVPRNVTMAIMLKVPVESHRHGDTVVAANHNPAVAALDLEDVPAGHGRNRREGEAIGLFRQQSFEQSARRSGRL